MPSDFFLAVREVVNAEDPADLLSGGAPEDEYDPEVEAIVARREAVSADDVAEIFQEYFGEDARLDHATAERIARAVAALHAR